MSPKEQQRRRVFVTRPIAEVALRRLAEHARVDLWDDDMPPSHQELIRHAAHAEAILSMVSDRFDAKTLSELPRLLAISNLAVGVDNIDLDAATRAHVAVGHTPGVLTETTADLAFALMMAAARRVTEGDRFVRSGKWRAWTPRLMLGRDVWGTTLGIIGWGAIGQAMARRAAGFGMRVLYTARRSSASSMAPERAERVDMKRLLAESDFVSIHVPLTAETRQMIGVSELAAMKPTAVLINTARGGVIDQAALAEALRLGRIAGAALDVAENEPILPEDPLLKLPNVVLTPHIGSASYTTRLKMAEMAVDNLLDVFSGRIPRCCANPAVELRERSSK